MMSSPVAGIDPHQSSFTVAVVDPQRCRDHPCQLRQQRCRLPRGDRAVELTRRARRSAWRGRRVGDRTSRSRSSQRASMPVRCHRSGRRNSGEHGAWPRPTTSTQCRPLGRCWPSRRSARCRRSRCTTALVAKIEAVLEHRRMLVQLRTLGLHHIADQLAKLPTEIRDQLGHAGQDRGPPGPPRPARHHTVGSLDAGRRLPAVMAAGRRRPGPPGAGRDPPAWNASWSVCSTSTAPRCATSPASVRSRRRRWSSKSVIRSASPASPSSLAGAAPAPSHCRPARAARAPIRHRLDYGGNRRINSVLYIASITQQRLQQRRPHLPRPQDRRGQDPTSSTPSTQAPPRQPRDPTHVERRNSTTRRPLTLPAA